MVSTVSEKEIMSVDDLAELLQVPKGTLYNWTSRGEGPPSIKVGRHRRYIKSEVLEWLKTQRTN